MAEKNFVKNVGDTVWAKVGIDRIYPDGFADVKSTDYVNATANARTILVNIAEMLTIKRNDRLKEGDEVFVKAIIVDADDCSCALLSICPRALNTTKVYVSNRNIYPEEPVLVEVDASWDIMQELAEVCDSDLTDIFGYSTLRDVIKNISPEEIREKLKKARIYNDCVVIDEYGKRGVVTRVDDDGTCYVLYGDGCVRIVKKRSLSNTGETFAVSECLKKLPAMEEEVK